MPAEMTSGTTTLAVVSIPITLGIGWLLSVLLVVVGRVRGSRPLFGWGVIGTGLMVLVSPLSVYLYFALRDGTFPVTPMDLLVLALLAFLGGAVRAWALPMSAPRPTWRARRSVRSRILSASRAISASKPRASARAFDCEIAR